MKEASPKTRKVYLDVLRIIAILCVIYNHTNEKGYYLYAFDCPYILKIIYIAVAAIIAVAVPIFFMVSGSLLIPKEESIKDLYRKRVLRMVIVLVIFSIIQYGYQIIYEDKPFSLTYFIKNVTADNITPAYWYLYAYTAYLIALPLIRRLALNMSDKEYRYLFAAFLIVEGLFGSLMSISGFGNMNAFFVVPFFNRVIIYPLLGYYMDHRVSEDKYNAKGAFKWIVLMIIVIAFITVMTLIRNLPYEEFTTYDKGLFTTGFTFVLDAGIFYVIKTLCDKRSLPPWLIRLIGMLSTAVFGVFLIENIIRDQSEFIYSEMSPVIGKFPAVIIWCAVVYLIGAVIINIVKLIPVVKKLL